MERRQIEEVWQKRAAEAAERYRSAAEELQRLVAEQAAGLSPDGSVRVRLARQLESQTRADYMHVLRVLTDLVTKGTIPREAVGVQAAGAAFRDGAPGPARAMDYRASGTIAATLTPREREVLALLAAGRTSKEISGDLGITFKTTACHRTRIMSKLGCRNVADLTRAAVRMGLVEP